MNTKSQRTIHITNVPTGSYTWTILLGIAMSWLMLPSARADIMLSILTDQPDEFVMAEYAEVAGSTGYQWRNTVSGGRRDLGQSFLADTAFDLAVFSLHSNGNIQVAAREEAYTLTVWESNVDTSIGNIISTQAGTWFDATAPSSSGNWVSFQLEDALSLTEGNYYTVMLSWDDVGPSHVWSQNSASGYAGGNIWQSTDGATYTRITSQDLLFTAQAIPEPGSLLLLLIGGLSAMLFVRRR
jgi:hypothetical protein